MESMVPSDAHEQEEGTQSQACPGHPRIFLFIRVESGSADTTEDNRQQGKDAHDLPQNDPDQSEDKPGQTEWVVFLCGVISFGTQGGRWENGRGLWCYNRGDTRGYLDW
jgi:hypothetical protein